MRSKTRTTVAAEQDKTNERKQATKKSSKAKTIATQRNSTSGEERDEAASTRLPDDELPHVGSRRSDLPQSFETEEMAGTPSAVSFDRDQQKRHGLACKQMRAGKFSKALKIFESILASMLERYGENHHRVGAALHNVGIANLRLAKLDDALDAVEEAVRIRKITLGAGDPKVADSLVELGIILLSLQQYEDSLKIFFEALAMRKKEGEDLVLPDDIKENNLQIAKVLNNIGCVNYEKGNYKQARESFEAAIRMQKKILGGLSAFSFTDPTKTPGFLTMASTLCNKGYIDVEQKEFWQAIQTFNASLEIQRCLLGADNKLILSTLDNLGFAYLCQGSLDAALNTYDELFYNQESSYSEHALDGAATLKKIVYVQLMQTNFEGGLKTLCLLEDIQRDHLSSDSKQLLQTRRLMGQTNYHVMKHPGFACFACGDGADDSMDLAKWKPEKPINGSKMSGHRVAYV